MANFSAASRIVNEVVGKDAYADRKYIDMTWDAVPAAIGYQYQIGRSGATSGTLRNLGNVTSYTIGPLAVTARQVRIRARLANAQFGPWTAIIGNL